MENLISIPGRLHSVAIEEHVAGANEIYDDGLEKLQDEINSYLVTNSITNVQYTNNLLRFYNSKGLIVKVIPLTLILQQSDYAESDSSKVTFIKNKPTIPTKTSDLTNDSGFITDISGKQDVIEDLDNIRSGAAAGATAYLKPQSGIPSTDLASDVQSDLTAIDDIEAVIPEQASSSNKLADINLMNSSIATATATFRGAYNLVTDLSLTISATRAQIATALATTIQTADNNDYCFVQIPVADATPTEIASVERYKFNGTAWGYEYTLNNSGYTAAQWAAINSGITSGLVTKLGDLPTATELATLLAGKQDTINDLSTIRSGASAGATAVQPSDLDPIEERLDDVEEALTESLPIESFVMDDYSIGSDTITGTNISSQGTVPIKEYEVPYVSGHTITIDGVTYSKAIRKDYTYPYTDGVLAKFDFEEKGVLMVYYGFGGGGSYGTYYLQFYFTSDDETITDELLASRDVFDTGREIDKLSITIPKKGTLTIKAWDRADGLEDNGYNTNIVRMDFTATPLIDVEDLKNSLSTVATSGSYNDLSDKPTIPDITGKADKVVNATNGNFAALDSNGNLVDSGHKHSDYLTQHQDVSGKEDKTPIEAVASGTTALTAQVNKYYEVAGTVSSLTVTLPTPTVNTEVTMVVVHFTAAANNPVVFVTSSVTVSYSAAYSVIANKEYELSCLYNGSKWIVSSMEVAV